MAISGPLSSSLARKKTIAALRETLARYLNEDTVRQELNNVHRYWHNALDKIVVTTPDTTVNLLVNGWLLYQTMACRLMARSGYYQSGGAFGFRDQLQDTLALSHAAPEKMREQIVLCASRQFIEGDVQHWWHPRTVTAYGHVVLMTTSGCRLPSVTMSKRSVTQKYWT